MRMQWRSDLWACSRCCGRGLHSRARPTSTAQPQWRARCATCARYSPDSSVRSAPRRWSARTPRRAWQVLGHEAELRHAGDYLSGEVAGVPALVVRAERARLYAFRNACRRRPHALVTARRGRLKSAIHCAAHSLTYSFDGRLVAGSTPGDLAPLPLRRAGRLLLVRAAAPVPAAREAAVEDST